MRRKVAGARASWSLAVFDEAHRLTPTSQYLGAAQELATAPITSLLLTATPHRGKEHYFRGLCSTSSTRAVPVGPAADRIRDRPAAVPLSFLRRMKEELKDLDGNDLFPARFAETVPVSLTEAGAGRL